MLDLLFESIVLVLQARQFLKYQTVTALIERVRDFLLVQLSRRLLGAGRYRPCSILLLVLLPVLVPVVVAVVLADYSYCVSLEHWLATESGQDSQLFSR